MSYSTVITYKCDVCEKVETTNGNWTPPGWETQQSVRIGWTEKEIRVDFCKECWDRLPKYSKCLPPLPPAKDELKRPFWRRVLGIKEPES